MTTAFVLSEATSPTKSSDQTKVGFIYKNKTVEPVVQKKCFTNYSSFYNGGDTSVLVNYPLINPFFSQAEDYLYANCECYY
jgi:predicted extracellular nuclease